MNQTSDFRNEQREQAKRLKIESSKSYRLIRSISTVMDKYYLDPVIGVIPNLGDLLGSLFSLPFIYVSLFKVRSIPLTLAVIYYNLLDILLGLTVPFWVGNIVDVFYRVNLKNFRLIQGFVEGDGKIISDVNRKAVYVALMIVALIALIYLMFRLLFYIGGLIAGLFAQ